MQEQFVPKEVGECVVDAGKDAQEVSFKGSDDALGNVAAMHVWGDKLESAPPGLSDDLAIVCVCFIVKDLVVDDVAAGLEALHDTFVGQDMVAVVTALEGFDEYGVQVAVKDQHYVLVSDV